MCVCVVAGAEVLIVTGCKCVCAYVRARLTRPCPYAPVWEALVHTNRRAVKMSVRLLIPRTVIGRGREETGNAAVSEGLEASAVS